MSSDQIPHDFVRELLRRGDPAADGRELDAAELARMRRTIVAAAGDAAPRSLGLWWLAVPSAVAAGLLLLVLRTAEPPEPLAAVVPIAVPAPAAPVVSTPAPSPTQVARVEPPPRTRRRVRAPKPAPAVQPQAAEAVVAQARQLEFQTPGGTRVVWVLDPHFTLDSSEATPQ